MSKKKKQQETEKATPTATATPTTPPAAPANRGGIVWIALLVLELAGLAVAIYLTYLKIKAGAADAAACNISETLSCDDVLASKYSSILGIPTSWLGVIVYVGMLLTTIIGKNASKSRFHADAPVFVFSVSIWNILFSLYLASISSFVLHKYCTNCIALYFVNIGLLGASFAWMRASGIKFVDSIGGAISELMKSKLAWIGGACLAIILAGSYIGFGKVLTSSSGGGIKVDFRGHDLSQYPTKGPANAPVKIVEFSDLKCPFCKKTHEVLQQAEKNYGDKFSVTYIHTPLDQSCNDRMPRTVHPGACLAASAARCAQQKGKFWEFIGVVFAGQEEVWDMTKMKEYAGKVGLDPAALEACIADPATTAFIKENVALGNEIHIQRTPTVFFNGVESKSFSGVGMPGFLEELQKALSGTMTPPEQPK